MAKPFVDPLDEEADAAEASTVKNRAGELAERMKAAREDDAEEVEVQEPDDDDEEEAQVAKTREQKRSERGRNRVSARERAAAAEARAQVLQEQLEAARNAPSRAPEPQQNNNEIARLEKKYEDILSEQERLFNEYQRATNLTAAQEADFKQRAARLEFQKTAAVVEIREAHQAPQRRNEEHKRAMAARAPDVYGNPTALAYAAGEYQKRLAMGEPDSQELHDAACEEARQVILGKRPPPDQAQRARASGMSNGARAPVGSQAPVRLSMPKGSATYRLAVAMYPNDEPGVACQKWANKHGKRYAEAVSKRA